MKTYNWIMLVLWLGLSIGNIVLSFKIAKLESQVKRNTQVIQSTSDVIIGLEQAIIINQRMIVNLIKRH